jgi:hypothetical protein
MHQDLQRDDLDVGHQHIDNKKSFRITHARPVTYRRPFASPVGLILVLIAIVGCGQVSVSPALPSLTQGSTPQLPIAAGSPYEGTFLPAAIAAWSADGHILLGASGLAGGSGVLGNSIDEGTTWQLVRLTAPPLLSGAMHGSSILAEESCSGNIPCSQPLILSKDAGVTWFEAGPAGARRPTPAGDVGWWAVRQSPSGEAAIISTSRIDEVWASLGNPCRGEWPVPFALSFVSGSDGFLACVGDSGAGQEAKELLVTSDAGATWKTAASISIDGANELGSIPGHGQLAGLSMADLSDGWLVTDDLLATKDGGVTWSSLNLGISDGSRHVISALLNSKTGAVLVEDDVARTISVLATSDQGLTWQPRASWPLPRS